MPILSSARQGLFDRLGGCDQLERAVTAFFSRLAALPEYAGLVSPIHAGDAPWHLQLLLTELLGGPMAYDGPDPTAVCHAAGIDADGVARLIEHLVAAFAAGGVGDPLLTELRTAVKEFAQSRGFTSATPAPATATGGRPGDRGPVDPLVRRAEDAAAAAGLADWPLFVLDAELVVVHQSSAAMGALPAADADLRRTFGLGALQLMGHSVLRFHSAPTQLHAMLTDTLGLPREVIWSFGRTTWRARLLQLPAVAPGRSGYAMAWRDESEGHRRDAVLARLRAQAEELPVPVMFPEAHGDVWYGNAACEHALAKLAPWLPAGFDASSGIPGALFFPDAEERRSLFTVREALPLKKRVSFGPETVSLLVSAVCDDDQRMLCPQVTWEIVYSIATIPIEPPAPMPAVVTPPTNAQATAPTRDRLRGLSEVSMALRREARAVEASAQALFSLTEVLDAMADRAGGEATGQSPARAENLVESGAAALCLAEQGLAALDAARELTSPDARQRAVGATLDQLMTIARRTNQLVLDASLSVVEDSMGTGVENLLDRSATVRQAVDGELGGLATQAQDVARQLAQAIGTATRLAELRESWRDAGPPRVVGPPEAVFA